MRYFILAMILLYVSSALSSTAFSQDYQPYAGPLISVGTDKSYYNAGDKIGIFGFVKQGESSSPLIIQITGSNGAVIVLDNIVISSDGTYAYTIKAVSNLWTRTGIYTVTVRYPPTNLSADITFHFNGNTQPLLTQSEFKVEGTNASISYSFQNGDSIQRVQANVQSNSLIISTLTPKDSQLIVDLPRMLIDASMSGKDRSFLVRMDNGSLSEYQDIQTSPTDRIITIPVSQGTKQIEIIGSHVIPEFNSVTCLVLVFTITLTVIIPVRMCTSLFKK